MKGQQQLRKMDHVQVGWVNKGGYFCEKAIKILLLISDIDFWLKRYMLQTKFYFLFDAFVMALYCVGCLVCERVGNLYFSAVGHWKIVFSLHLSFTDYLFWCRLWPPPPLLIFYSKGELRLNIFCAAAYFCPIYVPGKLRDSIIDKG